jgi:hypothetical protein
MTAPEQYETEGGQMVATYPCAAHSGQYWTTETKRGNRTHHEATCDRPASHEGDHIAYNGQISVRWAR